MKNKNILIVEDEAKIATLLKDYLEKDGYTVSILTRGDVVAPHVKKQSPDLILLDIMLPGMDGMEVCRQVRTFSHVPVIMVTAKVEEIDRLIGLELGADDYICKPFSPREVVARVKAVLRRTTDQKDDDHLFFDFDPLQLDDEKHTAFIGETSLTLTPSEFGLLKIMMKRPNRVFTRNELINQVLGYNFEGYDRTIDTHIKNLRKKIADYLPGKEIIVTVYGIGYKFSPPH